MFGKSQRLDNDNDNDNDESARWWSAIRRQQQTSSAQRRIGSIRFDREYVVAGGCWALLLRNKVAISGERRAEYKSSLASRRAPIQGPHLSRLRGLVLQARPLCAACAMQVRPP